MSLPPADELATLFAAHCGGADAVTVEEGFGPPSVDVPRDAWLAALRCARDELGLTYFDFLTGVDESATDPSAPAVRPRRPRAAEPEAEPAADVPAAAEPEPEGTPVRVVAHLARLGEPAGEVAHLVIRTQLPPDDLTLASAVELFRGAAWHERETYEMFGVDFTGHPYLVPLLLPDGFEGHPLRKSFVLAARAAKPWPGAKEPGESGSGAPARRRMVPPGVPDPETWGPR